MMTPIEHAQQLSDATFFNIETAFYYAFATPIGWTFWGVLAFLIVWGIASDAEQTNASVMRARHAARLREEAQQRWEREEKPLIDERQRRWEEDNGYRSPAGYNRGVKMED
jgi:hypothetical protein